jgi:hypothetical protein
MAGESGVQYYNYGGQPPPPPSQPNGGVGRQQQQPLPNNHGNNQFEFPSLRQDFEHSASQPNAQVLAFFCSLILQLKDFKEII